MKNLCLTLLVLIPTGIYAQNNSTTLAGAAQATTYHVAGSDADSRVWERMTYDHSPLGQVVTNVHRYTELASGLNHLVNGQWVASKEEIDILPNGTAAATNGQHQAYFPDDIYNGQIELVTPDGKQLFSRPVGLSYFDGTNSVLIAELTNSIGEVAGNNEVIYLNAFTDFGADIRYTYTKAGFEQDIILREQPPSPASFGLNPDTTRLQVLTEFFNPPQPVVSAGTVPSAAGDLEDDSLNFGMMQMGQGRAFLLGTNTASATVNKQWLALNGRQMLVEEVPVPSIADELENLPLPSITSIRPNSPLNVVSAKRLLPTQHLAAVPSRHLMRIAKAAPASSGLVLDYVTLNSSTNSFTFQGDTTYYISGAFDLSGTGTNTFEGGAVIKYARNAWIWLILTQMTLDWRASAYRPVIFTAVDDNSVGEVITNSTGNPTNYYAKPALMFSSGGGIPASTLQYARIAYAQYGIEPSSSPLVIRDSQFVNVVNPIKATGSSVTLENVLMYNVSGTALWLYGSGVNCVVQNLTVHNAATFLFLDGPSFGLANSLLIACTNLGSGFTGASNYTNSSDSGIFQTVGAGANYLATNCPAGIRNGGTTGIDTALLADLQTKTTYPPQVYTPQTISYDLPLSSQVPRDTCFPGPDLGYHYDPIDYAFSGVIVTNATMTVSPGTVIAAFGTNGAGYGLDIGAGGQLVCEGLAGDLNRIVTYNTVQEGSGGGWQPPEYASVSDYFDGAGGSYDFRFTDWSLIGSPNAAHLLVGNSYPVNFRDCQFHGGALRSFLGPTINLTNCLFDRVNVVINPVDGNIPVLQNNLFYGGNLDLMPFDSNHAVVQDNLFDRTTIFDYSSSYTYTGGNNAYVTTYVTNYNRLHPFGTGDVILTNPPVYQTGPLGTFYELTNSPLIDKGSENVDAAGLTGYTILTNQTPDTNTVDIGYHYKITGNDSTGTDFWLAFFNLQYERPNSYVDYNQSLYISSAANASGTVTYPVNGPILTITGDPTVSGTYILTNTPDSETNFNIGPTMYVNETNTNLQVVSTGSYYDYWEIWNYNPTNYPNTYYGKPDPYLNGSNWFEINGTGTMTSSCPQVLFSQPFSVSPGMVTNVPLPLVAMLDEFDAVEGLGIHVTATQPVSVYGFDYYGTVSTAFTAYPTSMLGTNYCLMARAASTGEPDEYSQFAIVGTVTNTTVTITPSATAGLAGSLWTNSFVLNQGDTYEINSSNTDGDVTGTLITSDKPIAVFAGADIADVPDYGTAAENPLLQEQLPVEQWGTNVVAMSFAGRLGDTFRVLAAYSNTVVTVSGIMVTNSYGSYGGTNYAVVTTNLDAGQYYEMILLGPAQFQSTNGNPIQVAQFGNGAEFDGSGNEEGDPCEILLPPTGQWMNSYTVYTSTNDYVTRDFDENYLNIIASQSATNAVSLDGSLVAATNFVAIGNSGYYAAQLVITNSGAHTVNCSQPVEVQVYGWGLQDAYSYYGGIVK